MSFDPTAYLEEAAELLAELETALLELEENPGDRDLVDRVFRAMHTIKGSGAMYGFDHVAGFTHEVETVLDRVREGEIPVSGDLVSLVLAARDQIRAILDAEAAGEPIPADDDDILGRLKALLPAEARGAAAETADARPETGAADAGAAADVQLTYRIRFRPPRDLFASGTNPILLLDELREMGTATIVARNERIPILDGYDPEACYVGWDIVLTTDRGRQAIEDVFIFVADDSTLAIEVIDEAGLTEDAEYKRLGEILVERGDISNEDLMRALRGQKRLGEILIEKANVPPEGIEAALAEQQHVRAVRKKRQGQQGPGSIRVASERLDRLVDLVGELVTVQARLTQKTAAARDPELLQIAEEVERLTEELRDTAMSIRMVPVGSLFGKFRRLVRDLARDLDKEVELVIEGAETELDKTVIDRLNDPLVHLVRNSMDHGIEPPAARSAAGKPAAGRLRLVAEHAGANVLIRVEDDGAGLDPARLKAKAVEKGIVAPDAELSDQECFQLIFAPGFSTAAEVSDVSGRGVGMDVVRRSIEALGGSIQVTSVPGRSTTVSLVLPLTLAIIDGLLVQVETGFYVVPLAAVDECLEIPAAEAARCRERGAIEFRGVLHPYLALRERFGIPGSAPEIEQVVMVHHGEGRAGIGVDRVVGQHQTVIKGLTKVYRDLPGLAGATILGDGTVALILDVNGL